jgi:ribosomal protein S27AE
MSEEAPEVKGVEITSTSGREKTCPRCYSPVAQRVNQETGSGRTYCGRCGWSDGPESPDDPRVGVTTSHPYGGVKIIGGSTTIVR